MDSERLNQLLRQVRAEAGICQAELAERLGRRQSFVSKYELGQRRLDLIQLMAVCQAVGITATEFVTRFENGEHV
jgi:transcriptional regulator with XRE-family HTH domain